MTAVSAYSLAILCWRYQIGRWKQIVPAFSWSAPSSVGCSVLCVRKWPLNRARQWLYFAGVPNLANETGSMYGAVDPIGARSRFRAGKARGL